MSNSQFGLLQERRFLPLFLTQFLGAFNDNVFKTALITLVIFRAGQLTQLDGKTLATLLPGLFILPFFLFSATSGQVADKFEKSAIARGVKLFEIAVMSLAAWGFIANNLWPLVAALFLMGLHSTIFGPVKYGYLPQHLDPKELVGGNGMIEMGTFVAILLGEVLGALLATLPGVYAATTVMAIAVLGWWVSRDIPLTPAVDAKLVINWNPFSETWRNLRFAKTNRTVWLSLLGISWFWFYGATLLAQFPTYSREVLGGDESVFILLLTFFSFGIGVGSLLCERLSGHKVEIGLVPFGAIGLTLFGIDLYFATPAAPLAGATALHFTSFLTNSTHWRLLADIVLLGLFGGFYIVPLYALVQTRSEKSHQSRIIAANNILNAFFMVLSAGVSMLLFSLGLTIPQLFLATALMSAVVTIYIYTLVPEFLMRFMVWLLVHSVYRLEKQGLEHIPEEGPALVVCNHVSFVDPLVIMAACPRPIRFVMDHHIFKLPLLSFVFREARAIPVAPARENAKLLDQAYEEIAKALAAGEVVAIFPEGRITDTGELYPFKNGVRRILDRTPVPVIPMALRGLWGSFFSRKDGPAMTRPFRRGAFSRIGLAVGSLINAATATPETLQQTVAELRGDRR